LAKVVLQQAVMLAVAGFVPGAALAKLMYLVTTAGAGIPIRFTLSNFVLVLVLSLSMCMVSGLLAVRKTFKADPADLF
jgi:putative ABC transport system permease protein